MAKPPTATAFAQALDPSDEVDFYVIVSQGTPEAEKATILLIGEAIAAYDLTLSPEAVAAGLEIMDGVGEDGVDRTNRLTGNELKLWLQVAEDARGAAMFDGSGTTFEIAITIATNQGRRKRRTILVRIARQ